MTPVRPRCVPLWSVVVACLLAAPVVAADPTRPLRYTWDEPDARISLLPDPAAGWVPLNVLSSASGWSNPSVERDEPTERNATFQFPVSGWSGGGSSWSSLTVPVPAASRRAGRAGGVASPPPRIDVPPTPLAPAAPSVPPPATRHFRTQIVSTNGLIVHTYLGANDFYTAGYTGSRAIMANIEGQHMWNGHEVLTHVTQFLTGPGAVGSIGSHPTGVGHMMGGRPANLLDEGKLGVAYGATLWSGAIATAVNGGEFDVTFNSFFQPYVTALRTGIGGQTADVTNSSYGDRGDSAGRTIDARSLDALAWDTRKVMVFAAGNEGPNTPTGNTVLFPATAYNVISVAALGTDTSSPPYAVVSAFSSRGPQDVFVPAAASGTSGTTVPGGRIRVDIAAPGENLLVAAILPPPSYSNSAAGTSYAAPMVAGGVALMVDAGRAQSAPAITNYADVRVVKAVLMNAADKIPGWNNGQASYTYTGTPISTTQAVDGTVGAGRLNLAQALPYYADPASTRDVPGTVISSPVVVQNRGYDFAAVTRTGQNDYVLPATAVPVARMNVTLSWMANRGISQFTAFPGEPTEADFTENRLANLNVQVFRLGVGGTFDTLLAESVSPYNNTEHLHLLDLTAGQYGIRVTYPNDAWNFTADAAETYGLAWNLTPVPEPAGVLAIGAAALAGLAALRRAAGFIPAGAGRPG